MTRIILVGYMGSGKTTLGRLLAEDLGLSFIDLDWYIENRFCRTITQLFVERGEDGFRKLEREMLHEVAEFENVVIASGGGTPCFFDNIDYMNRQAQTVYLKATPEVLFCHLQHGQAKRPLLAQKKHDELKAYIEESLAKRVPFYEKATYQLVTNLLENSSQIKATVAQLRNLLNL